MSSLGQPILVAKSNCHVDHQIALAQIYDVSFDRSFNNELMKIR